MGVLFRSAVIVRQLLRAGLTVGVFFFFTDQIAVFIPAFLAMGMLFFPAGVDNFLCRLCLTRLTLGGMGVLFQAARQFPGPVASLAVLMAGIFFGLADQFTGFIIAPLAMHMGAIALRYCAGKHLRIHRDFHVFKAGRPMPVLQHLGLPADEVPIRIQAVVRVPMKNDLFFPADKGRFRAVRFLQFTGKDCIPCEAFLRVSMIAFHAAGQLLDHLVAVAAVLVAVAFLQAADDLAVFIQAVLRMLMPDGFFQAADADGRSCPAVRGVFMRFADQLAALLYVAILPVGVALRLRIAGILMGMHLDFRQRTP